MSKAPSTERAIKYLESAKEEYEYDLTLILVLNKVIETLTAQQKKIEELEAQNKNILGLCLSPKGEDKIPYYETKIAEQSEKILAQNTLIEQVKGTLLDHKYPNHLEPDENCDDDGYEGCNMCQQNEELNKAIAAIEEYENGK